MGVLVNHHKLCLQPTGNYSGCGTTVTDDTTQTFHLDPLTKDAHLPWDARSMPQVSWPKEDGKMYTLIIIDPGFGFVHGIFINIEGDLSSLANVGQATVSLIVFSHGTSVPVEGLISFVVAQRNRAT